LPVVVLDLFDADQVGRLEVVHDEPGELGESRPVAWVEVFDVEGGEGDLLVAGVAVVSFVSFPETAESGAVTLNLKFPKL
jgi:hypothetical protein